MIEDVDSVDLFVELFFKFLIILLELNELWVLILGGVGLIVVEFEG